MRCVVSCLPFWFALGFDPTGRCPHHQQDPFHTYTHDNSARRTQFSTGGGNLGCLAFVVPDEHYDAMARVMSPRDKGACIVNARAIGACGVWGCLCIMYIYIDRQLCRSGLDLTNMHTYLNLPTQSGSLP